MTRFPKKLALPAGCPNLPGRAPGPPAHPTVSPLSSKLEAAASAPVLRRPPTPLDDARRHLPQLQSIARRLLGCDHLAADAVQEALVALWQQDTPPPHPKAWMMRAVVHRAQHLRRTARRRQHHEHTASQHCHLHGSCDNPLHIAVAHEVGEQLSAALDTLPTDFRQALELYTKRGLDYADIAARLELPIGTVRSRLHRARHALRAALEPPATRRR